MCLYRRWQLITQCDLYGKNLTARHLHQCEMTCQNNVTWSERNKFINADMDDRQFFFLVVVVVFLRRLHRQEIYFCHRVRALLSVTLNIRLGGLWGIKAAYISLNVSKTPDFHSVAPHIHHPFREV